MSFTHEKKPLKYLMVFFWVKMQCHRCVLEVSEKRSASMFRVTESGSGVCQSSWEERNMWVIWEITHISFSQPYQHPPESYSVILLMKAVHSSETWNTHLQNGV
jgi:hypothetical protein